MPEAAAAFERKKGLAGPQMKWWLASGVLLLALILQVIVANRAVYAQNAMLRPVVTAVCAVFRCEVPAWQALAAFKMESHDVVAHPDHAEVLQIRGSFRNTAALPQAWPVLRVTLSDVNGTPIYRGDFLASQYLAGGQVPPTLGAGQTALIELNVRDPSQRAVSFNFAFREVAVTPATKSR